MTLPLESVPRYPSTEAHVYMQRYGGGLGMDAKDPLHNSLRPVINRTRTVCCVVFLVNSGLLTAKRRLAAHPDPAATDPQELCRGSLRPAMGQEPSAVKGRLRDHPFQLVGLRYDSSELLAAPVEQIGGLGGTHLTLPLFKISAFLYHAT